MKWLLRSSSLILISAALAVGAIALVLWPASAANRAIPLPVGAGAQEVVWLNPATNASGWERFVSAVHRVEAGHPELHLHIDDRDAFPRQTTTVPQIAVELPQTRTRLWFRWYKLTADLTMTDWLEALAARQPAPLAIIGGGSSDRARDLAQKLQEVRTRHPEAAPLLLITTATADEVSIPDDPSRSVALNQIYEGRTYRFCFTNRQMAEAVADFLWSRDELRPDAEPVYLVAWKDDPYSEDLADRFRDVLWSDRYHGRSQQLRQARTAAGVWGWLAGLSVHGGREALGPAAEFMPSAGPFWHERIPYSIGTFSRPNRPEAEACARLMEELAQHPEQQRPLLILPATPLPARRFLRGLMEVAPAEAGRFVVASGDSIDFNTIYRDRQLTWSIQDLPYALVLFYHRNPVDRIMFRPEPEGSAPDDQGAADTGTEDLLLNADIVRTLVRALDDPARPVRDADALGRWLHEEPEARFNAAGNRPSGTGEYIVYLQPQRIGDRLLPRARLQVYRATASLPRERGEEAVAAPPAHAGGSLKHDAGGAPAWKLVRELEVDYTRPEWYSAEPERSR